LPLWILQGREEEKLEKELAELNERKKTLHYLHIQISSSKEKHQNIDFMNLNKSN
jgi:hypothetical protein